MLFRSFFVAKPPEGWTTVMVAVLLVGGVQLIISGILGEYIWRISEEVKGRPPYLIEIEIPSQTSVGAPSGLDGGDGPRQPQ